MKYFDAHCHVQFPMYDSDRDAVLSSMQASEVGGLVVGVDRASSEKAIALVDGRENLWATVGLHPNDTPDEVFDMEVMRTLVKHPNVVAIGECGLDNYRPEDPESEKGRQREVFQKHIDLAIETGKPLIIHARPTKGSMDAYEDALEMVEAAKKANPSLRGDFHFFVGDVATAKRIIDLDFTISYTAVLTFTHDYDEVVRSVPLTHILSETDSPYVAPKNRRGERNDPLAVRDVVAAIASIRGEDEEVVRSALLANSKRLFGV
jgi:TatD DNase family protein